MWTKITGVRNATWVNLIINTSLFSQLSTCMYLFLRVNDFWPAYVTSNYSFSTPLKLRLCNYKVEKFLRSVLLKQQTRQKCSNCLGCIKLYFDTPGSGAVEYAHLVFWPSVIRGSDVNKAISILVSRPRPRPQYLRPRPRPRTNITGF